MLLAECVPRPCFLKLLQIFLHILAVEIIEHLFFLSATQLLRFVVRDFRVFGGLLFGGVLALLLGGFLLTHLIKLSRIRAVYSTMNKNLKHF